MKYIQLPIEFCAFLADANDPTRPMAYHVTVATFLDSEDGSPLEEVASKRKTMTPKQCLEAGLQLPDVVMQFDSIVVRANQGAEAKIAELQSQIETMKVEAEEKEKENSQRIASSLSVLEGLMAENRVMAERLQTMEALAKLQNANIQE